MDALLAGAELDDVPGSEDCGSRLVGLVAVVVVPSEETVLIWGVATLRGQSGGWWKRGLGSTYLRECQT